MNKIRLLKAHAENFKRFKELDISFEGKNVSINGQNYKGKSSVADLFSWILFNKSSTGNTEGKHFRPRRYDEHGVNIDYVDVVGEIVLLVNEEEIKIQRVQKQKWTRHHGDDFDSYEGDSNDYFWNDVPVSPTEHKKKVEGIIKEDVFRMLSNPATFPSMDAKKQRDFLLKNVANITDDEVFASNPEFELVKEAMGTGSLDELVAKNKKEISEYEKKKTELPARIDQERKHIEEVDFSEEEKKLNKLQSDLSEVEGKIEDTGKAYEKLNELKAEKARFESELVQIERSVREEAAEKKREIQSKYDSSNTEFNSLHEKQKTLEYTVQIDNSEIERKEKELSDLRDEYKTEMSKELDESAYICPTCGQEIPESQREEIKDSFEKKKSNAIKSINERGSILSQLLKEHKEKTQKRLEEIEDIKNKKVSANAERNKAMQELTEFENAPVDLINNKDFLYAKEQLEKLDKEIAEVDTKDADTLKAKLKEERAGIQASIDAVKEKLALKAVIEKSKVTVKELEEKMKQVVQSLADCEKLSMAIEKFNKAKMSMLSERINEHFKVVTWKLFEKQKNQRYSEVCVCQINGSDYGENTTSTTERMMAGMDIIRTLQSIYQAEVPIFLDDADLYNDWNIPDMDSQIIKLCVSEDEDLVINCE